MLLGIISDVHANALALEACLASAERLGVERLVFLGDAVGYGADPEAVTQRLMELAGQGALAVMGNHDAAALGERSSMNPVAEAAIAWTKPRLSDSSRNFLASLPLTAELDGLLFVHAEASAPSAWHYVTDASAALRSLTAAPQRVTFCGHVHRPQVYCLTATAKVIAHTPVTDVDVPLSPQRQWLAVAGSAGQPRDLNPAASFLTYDTASRLLTFRRAPYDHEAAAARVRAAGLPEELALRLIEGS
jgi:diadenosine tetraphosphatase ApaH/serine/threonine PP2A family protein phosphatase